MDKGYPIQICNYTFLAVWKSPKGQKINREVIKLERCPLVGSDENEIRQDPTGANKSTMRRNFSRIHKNINVDQCTFNIIMIDIIKQYGITQWIEKK